MLKRIKSKTLRRVLLGVLIIVGLPAGWYLVNRAVGPLTAVRVRAAQPGTERKPLPAGRLRIGCYNIAHGRGLATSNWRMGSTESVLERLRQIAALLREQELDIVILNEVDFDSVWSGHVNQAEHIVREAGFPFRAEQRNIDAAVPFVSIRFGNVVLSRWPIRDARRIDYPSYKTWETILAGRKDGLLCTVAISDAFQVRVLAVHLEHRSETTRVRSARIIDDIRVASPLPLIAAGDFNSTCLGSPWAFTDREGRTAISSLLETGGYRTLPAKAPRPEDLTFPSVKPRSVIDWILVPPSWTIRSKTVIDSTLSDHKLVVMEVELPRE